MPPARCFWHELGDCDGHLQRAHLISKSRIRREFAANDLSPGDLHVLLWHPTCWRWMCERHHVAFDEKRLVLAREQVPPDVEAYAATWGLEWSLDADYGER